MEQARERTDMVAANFTSTEKRPLREALLKAANREHGHRGRLKIFLGAAPGVGKTFEMLMSAQARKREGVDVVIGIIDTHGRAETQALVEGLELLPRRRIRYRDHILEEMDLDAILSRKSQLVLVDELAHSNTPDSRHPKRYLDIEELLGAGIDVYTTLNIQHVESLNDVVAQITRIRVRETVPDQVLDRADDIEVIDLSPDDLLQRLEEGKVYIPKQAERARKHYFSPGNLTALRELALRRTAQRVDAQLLTHMRAHAIEGPWPAGDRIVVAISEDPAGPGLVRYAKRMADRLHAPLTALYIETARTQRLNARESGQLADTLRLAEQLGADAVTVPGQKPASSILDWSREHNVTHIVLGKSRRARWFELLHGSVVHDLVRRAGGISVHVVSGDGTPLPMRQGMESLQTGKRPEVTGALNYGWSAIAVGVALLFSLSLRPLIGVNSVDLVFLVAILVVAFRLGLVPSLVSCIASVLCYNFFFLPPLYTLTITNPENIAALAVFSAVAVIASNLGSRMRAQAVTAQKRARTNEALYGFSRKIVGIASLDDLLWATCYQIASMLRVNVVLLLPEGGALSVRAGYPPEDELDDADLGAARWAWANNRPAGRDSDTLPGARRLFLPLRTDRGPVGIIGIDRDSAGLLLTPDERRLLEALMDQAAVAIERIRLAQDVDAARLAAETERLRAALLTSLSHDLKTPLASILGAVTALRDYKAVYDAGAREELVETIHDEAERMTRFVANLLDMTRIESGEIELQREPTDIGEVVGSALRRAGRLLQDHKVDVELAADLPLLCLDAVLFEQVMVNLLDNAAKYSAPKTAIAVRANGDGSGAVSIQVLDEGPGIPPEDLDRIFEKFYRVRLADYRPAGTGLGLAICDSFVRSLGGTIRAENRKDGIGAVFTVKFPASLCAEPVSVQAEAVTATNR
jgi:two-component system sensor histidine kinase KdpD